jgi:hypothetical protein
VARESDAAEKAGVSPFIDGPYQDRKAPTTKEAQMRIVLIGVAHWHTPFYLDPLLTMP